MITSSQEKMNEQKNLTFNMSKSSMQKFGIVSQGFYHFQQQFGHTRYTKTIRQGFANL